MAHWYLLGALVIQVLGTHKVKFFLPIAWTDFWRSRAVEAISAGLGFAAGAGMFLTVDGIMQPAGATLAIRVLSVWVGLIVAVAGPVLYKAAIALLYAWKPELRGTLSADTAAKVKRKIVQSAAGALTEMDADAATPDGDKTVAEFSRTVMMKPPAGGDAA